MLGNNLKLNQRLDKVNRLVDWKPFEKRLNRIYSSPKGKPSHPVLLLFQAWYNLSDYALEEILDDRLSFRRFIGLSTASRAPDHSVFSRFRDPLIVHHLHEKLFAELGSQLERKNFIKKKGTLVNTTVIETAQKKPNQNEF